MGLGQRDFTDVLHQLFEYYFSSQTEKMDAKKTFPIKWDMNDPDDDWWLIWGFQSFDGCQHLLIDGNYTNTYLQTSHKTWSEMTHT